MITDDLTKISFNACQRAVTALAVTSDHAGLSRTDTLNRAVQFYAALTGLGWWQAIRLLLKERATVRRWAGEAAQRAEAEAQP